MTSFEKKKGKDLCNEKPRKPSAKVKNPCKICNETVNFRTGLQCKGACKKWAHFDCLKFSSKQVEDIQCGFIKINCPCPDCENDTKVNQSQYDKNKEYQFQPYGRYNECNKPFCPGIPQQKSSQKLNNLDSLNQMSKPLPYGVSEGTSYEYIVENQTNNVVTIKRTENEQNDNDNLGQEEDEEKSDVEEIEDKCQTVLLAQSSPYSTEAICFKTSQMSPNKMGVTNEQTTKYKCCEGGPCNASSSSTITDKMTNEKKQKKGKEKNVKEKKDRKDKNDKKVKKEKKDKKEQKDKKEKKANKKKRKVKKGYSAPCYGCPCCNSDAGSKGSKESGYSYDSETSGSSSQNSNTTKSTQAACAKAQYCPRKGARSPLKLTKAEGCNRNVDDKLYTNLKAPRPGPRPPQQQQKEYPIPPPYNAQIPTCAPTCKGMQPVSNYPPNLPGGGRGQIAAVTRILGKRAACVAACCDPYRARTIALCSPISTQVLRLSPLNESKSCCTLDKSNKKEGTNSSTEISAHLVKSSQSDTKTWDQRQIEDYNRKMLLVLERMCHTMGQFSVQCRELMNKLTDKTDTQRREEFT